MTKSINADAILERADYERDLKAAGCSDVFRKALSSVFDWITGKASTSKGEASRGLTSVGEGDDGVDLQNRLDGLRRGRAEGVQYGEKSG